jgi:hypothetical protein
MSQDKKRYDGPFQPYRKPRGEALKAIEDREATMTEVTNLVSKALLPDVVAMDTAPKKGTIGFRDGNGKVWVLTIEASDVPDLKCEYDLRKQNEALKP